MAGKARSNAGHRVRDGLSVAAMRDFAGVLTSALVAYWLASHIELGERFTRWAQTHEVWQADELPFTLIVFCLGLGWFAWRRLREAAVLRRQLSALARHLMTLQERERREIAGELHDEMGQRCAAIRFEAQCILRALNREPMAGGEVLAASTHAIVTSSEALHEGVRRLLRQLRPAALEVLGPSAAIEQLAADWQACHRVAVECSARGIGAVPEMVAAGVYRIVQEALTNIAKHASATRVGVVLRRDDDWLHLEVSDDGVGFPASGPASRGFGLTGIAERIADLGGRLDIRAAPGRGVRIRVALPVGGAA